MKSRHPNFTRRAVNIGDLFNDVLKVSLTAILITCFLWMNGQQKSLLKRKDFQQSALDQSWIIAKYKKTTSPSAYKVGYVPLGKEQPTPSILDGIVKIPLRPGADPIDECNKLLKDTNVLYAEPIVNDPLLNAPVYVPDDPLTNSQYYLSNIKAYDAWEVTKGDDDIAIGIIDSGIDLDHDDLMSDVWVNVNDPIDGIDNDKNGYVDDYFGYDFADDDNDPEADQNTHGVRVGGIAGAVTDNGIGIAGIGFNTKIAALKAFQTSTGFSSGLFDAILYAANNGIELLNLSWGSVRQPLQSEQDIIDYAVLEKEVVIVAAAGNDGNKPTGENNVYPASYDHVLSVGGTNADDSKWSGSSYYYAVDLVAPASAVLSTIGNNSYNSTGGYGTSFAAPMVAAAAALVEDRFPDLTGKQLMERVRATADDIYSVVGNEAFDGKMGKGRLNILRAVSESNVKSLRAENTSLASSHGSSVFFGDTVNISATLTNYLSNLDDPSIYISSPNDDFTVAQGSFFPGFMSTLDTKEINFEIVISETVLPETLIGIRLDYADASYTDFQFLEVTTSPDHIDFGNQNVNMTITGDGDLGLVTYGLEEEGSGFVYQGDVLMKYTGIMLATDATSVADNIISSYTDFSRGTDFTNRKNYKIYHHPGADYFGYSEFTDALHHLMIAQSNIAWENEDFLMVRYRIVNNNPDAVINLSFGVFADWNLGTPTENYSEYDVTGDYLLARTNSSTLFAATKIISDGMALYSALDMDNQNGNSQDVFDTFSDAHKYDFLINHTHETAGISGNGNNVAGIHGVTIDQISPYDAAYVTVIYGVADSKSNLEKVLSSAEMRLETFLQRPRVLETFYTCAGIGATLDPKEGINYEFYKDPIGMELITTGTEFRPGTITKDTSFFVRNIDENYPSDFFEIRLVLLNDIADFELSTDTLYLDHSTINPVQFNSLNPEAVTWNWDFGEGSMSSNENPSFSYSEAGTYAVTLTIENEQGCVDSITKNLMVVNRPDDPVLGNFMICPGENIILSLPSASKLNVFAVSSQQTPSVSGNNLEVGPFSQDTSIYVSAVIDGLETVKVPVNIDIHDLMVGLHIVPDTLSVSHQLLLTSVLDPTATFEWFVNEISQGFNSEISVTADVGDLNVRLDIQTAQGCNLSIEEVFSVSTSPTATANDITACQGSEVMLIPENGTYFGFYKDPELTTLISKGTRLLVHEDARIYVVNLDDGLPGMPIEVTITFESFEAVISYELSRIGNKNKVVLSASGNMSIANYRWFINKEWIDTSENPTFFFDDDIVEVVLEATNDSGCLSRDAVPFDFTPPLSIDEDSGISIYPNPSNDYITIDILEEAKFVRIKNASGREMNVQANGCIINISGFSPGLYIIEIVTSEGKKKFKFLKD